MGKGASGLQNEEINGLTGALERTCALESKLRSAVQDLHPLTTSLDVDPAAAEKERDALLKITEQLELLEDRLREYRALDPYDTDLKAITLRHMEATRRELLDIATINLSNVVFSKEALKEVIAFADGGGNLPSSTREGAQMRTGQQQQAPLDDARRKAGPEDSASSGGERMRKPSPRLPLVDRHGMGNARLGAAAVQAPEKASLAPPSELIPAHYPSRAPPPDTIPAHYPARRERLGGAPTSSLSGVGGDGSGDEGRPLRRTLSSSVGSVPMQQPAGGLGLSMRLRDQANRNSLVRHSTQGVDLSGVLTHGSWAGDSMPLNRSPEREGLRSGGSSARSGSSSGGGSNNGGGAGYRYDPEYGGKLRVSALAQNAAAAGAGPARPAAPAPAPGDACEDDEGVDGEDGGGGERAQLHVGRYYYPDEDDVRQSTSGVDGALRASLGGAERYGQRAAVGRSAARAEPSGHADWEQRGIGRLPVTPEKDLHAPCSLSPTGARPAGMVRPSAFTASTPGSLRGAVAAAYRDAARPLPLLPAYSTRWRPFRRLWSGVQELTSWAIKGAAIVGVAAGVVQMVQHAPALPRLLPRGRRQGQRRAGRGAQERGLPLPGGDLLGGLLRRQPTGSSSSRNGGALRLPRLPFGGSSAPQRSRGKAAAPRQAAPHTAPPPGAAFPAGAWLPPDARQLASYPPAPPPPDARQPASYPPTQPPQAAQPLALPQPDVFLARG